MIDIRSVEFVETDDTYKIMLKKNGVWVATVVEFKKTAIDDNPNLPIIMIKDER